MKFEDSLVQIQLSQYLETVNSPKRYIYNGHVGPVTKSPLEVLRDLKYQIPTKDHATDTQSTLKEVAR